MERQQSRPVIIPPISSLIWSHRRVRLPGWFGGMALILCLWSVLSAHAASRDPLESLVSHLASVSEESLGLDILRGMKSGVAGRRGLPLPTDWSKVESRWGRHKNAEIRLLVQTLGLTFESTAAAGALREMLIDEKAPAAQRRGALDALTAAKDPQLPPVLRSLLASPALRAPAIRALAGFDDPETPGALMAAYPGLQTAEKRYVLNTLASRVSFAKVLASALKAGTLPATDLTAELVRQLRSLKDTGISADLDRHWGVARETSEDKQKEIQRYRRIYAAGGSTPGDASRGRQVFAKICQQCHVLFDAGGKVGPDLTGSNRADLDYILSNMVDPNAVIPNDYRSSTVELKDDRVLTGIVKAQDDRTLTVATASEVLVIPKSDVKSLQLSELSMMPEGLLAPLTDVEVRDLIYYLSRPGQVP